MTEDELRLEALRFAADFVDSDSSPQDTVQCAEVFLSFLRGSPESLTLERELIQRERELVQRDQRDQRKAP